MSWSLRVKLFVSTFIQKKRNRKRYKGIRSQTASDLESIRNLGRSATERKGTLIAKCDDIGDFIVWQQVIPLLETHAKRPLYFVGNKTVKPIYETYFDFADEVLWIDKSQWHDQAYRMNVYEQVSSWNVGEAMTTLFTRNFIMEDMIVLASGAVKTYAWDRQIHPYFPKFDDLDPLFSNSIHVDPNELAKLEYLRNIEFVEKIYGLPPQQVFKPLFPDFRKHSTLVVIPVASMRSKTWAAEKFARTIQRVMHRFDRIILLGGANAIPASEIICDRIKDPKLVNLVNQTKLTEIFAFIGEARLVLTLDTFSAHLGPLCVTDTVVIANGTSWQRFLDYEPFVRSKYRLVLPPHFKKVHSKVKLYYNGSEIQTIQVDAVVKAIEEVLND